MASIKTKFAVGLFLTLGSIIAIAAIIFLGMSHLFDETKPYVAFFDESVQGLDQDSLVKYRGVTVGRVQRIKVAPDATLVEVIMKIDTDLKPNENLVAQLKSVGITGMVYVELDRITPGDQALLTTSINPAGDRPIPTKPSEIKQLMQSLDDAFANINALDIQGISDRMIATLDSISAAVEDADIRTLSAGIQRSLKKIEKAFQSIDTAANSFNDFSRDTRVAVNRIDALIADSQPDLRDAIAELKQTVADIDQLIKGTDGTVQMLGKNLEATLQNIEEASNHLNRTLELIADQPSQLVFGEPSRPRELPAE